eukprot:CAMPEP_0183343274 /NCGR_PEP_ID=MMETSP0164_2-20130417/9219_1 /TAXON_ID=221442 /ORGANISM="Coccolithus pelagicus ssp braarudi, Strain PLY182g" /LENGTH=473 /DNA_ID=CAMNT_0025514055 /DNA_START=27 /DNA_END=1448 /DNA_ORIENTATION=-
MWLLNELRSRSWSLNLLSGIGLPHPTAAAVAPLMPAAARLLGQPSYLRPFLVASLLYQGWELYIRVRRKRRLAATGIPDAVKEAMPDVDETEYAKAQEYSAAKNGFGFVADAYGVLTGLVSLYLQPMVWNGPALRLALHLGLTPEHEIARAGLGMLICAPWELLHNLPIDAYRTFVIEERFGFNKHTWRSWVGDTLKHFLVEGMLINAIMTVPLVLLVRSLGASAWFYGFVFLTSFALLFNMAYPVWIAPLFNTFTPLEDGEVRSAIEALVRASGISCERIFQVDGSRQSSHSNAYVAGFFRTKRIVIYDTLLGHLESDVDAICAVVAHEIGHAAMHHNYALLGVLAAQMFVMFSTFGFCTDPRIVTDFGFDAPCAYLTLQTFFTLYGVVMPAFSIGLNAFTRQLEYSADAYSVRLGFDIRAALVKISKTNLSDLNPDPLDSLCNHSHPTTVQRVLAVKDLLDHQPHKGAKGD